MYGKLEKKYMGECFAEEAGEHFLDTMGLLCYVYPDYDFLKGRSI